MTVFSMPCPNCEATVDDIEATVNTGALSAAMEFEVAA